MSNNFKTKKVIANIQNVFVNKWNPNVQSDFLYQKEKDSIQKFGFIGSIIVRELDIPNTYEIIDGEHRYRACKELKYSQIPVETVGQLNDNEAKVLLMLMNIKGKDDLEKQAALFKSIGKTQLSLLPFTEQEINNVIDLFNFDFTQYEKQKEVKKERPKFIKFDLDEQELIVIKKAIVHTGKKDTEALIKICLEDRKSV